VTLRARAVCLARLLLSLIVLAPALGGGAAFAAPREVRFGCFVTSISNLSPADGSFRMVAYIWTVDPAGTFDPATDLQVLARESLITAATRTTLPDGSVHAAAVVDATVDHAYDVRAYPFDRETLRLRFESVEDSTELVFVPDRADSRIADFVELPGWHIDRLDIDAEPHRYDTGFGHRIDLPTFSRVSVDVHVARNRSPLLLGKFTGFLIAFVITAMVYAVPPGELGVRLGMTTGSIFSAVFNRYRLEDSIGFDAAFGLADQTTLLISSVILVTLVLSIVSHQRLQRTEDKAAVVRADRRLGAAVILVHLALFALAFGVALA
jgi:hypothetical protein